MPQELRSAVTANQYLLIQFSREPTSTDIEELQMRGFRTISYVPDQALIVTGADASLLAGLPLLLVAALAPEDKLSPEFQFLGAGEQTTVLVVLHESAQSSPVRNLLPSMGWALLEHPDLAPNHLLASGPVFGLRGLASLEPVAYVLPASRELRSQMPVHVCQGTHSPVNQLLVAAELSATFGDGWDGPGQGRAELSYYLAPLPPGIAPASAHEELERAIQAWREPVDIEFSFTARPNQNRSLDLGFVPRRHGDGFDFDGPGGRLAHSFYPPPVAEPSAGDIHFDEEEPWRLGGDPDVFSVALHELGHALGLAHSNDAASVMYPYYRRYAEIQAPDVAAIRQLYAARPPAAPVLPHPQQPAPGTAPPAGSPSVPALPPLPPLTPAAPPQGPPQTPITPSQPPDTTPNTPTGPDRTAPSLVIESPILNSFVTTAVTLEVRGRADDDKGVVEVRWQTAAGDSGVARGTTQFLAGPIPLYPGLNRIVVRAFDAAGNSSWTNLLVTRR